MPTAPRLYAICRDCGLPSPVEGVSTRRLVNHGVMTQPCPSCGGTATVPNGVYEADVVRGVYRVLEVGATDRAALLALAELVHDLDLSDLQPEVLADQLNRAGWRKLLPYIPRDAESLAPFVELLNNIVSGLSG